MKTANQPLLSLKGITKRFGALTAVDGVDLDVCPGEIVVIIGPSGSGKSTLFHIIGGLTPPTSGEVRVAGQDLAAMTEAGRTRLRKRSVAFVFQKFNLLASSNIVDNVALPLVYAHVPHAVPAAVTLNPTVWTGVRFWLTGWTAMNGSTTVSLAIWLVNRPKELLTTTT